MNPTNILDPIWESYLTTIDCLKVASRSIENNELHLMDKTRFVSYNVPQNSDNVIRWVKNRKTKKIRENR